jgi:dTDP-4-amino-4,6-dideoxygalactose transaminase
LHLQQAYAYLGYRAGDFPIAEAAAQRILSLPMFPEITDQQIDLVCEELVKTLNA